MMKRLLGMGGASLLAAACTTPLPVVRLMPHDANVTWVAGRAVTTRDKGGIRAAAAFDRQDGRAVAFRVEVENDSGEALVVDPNDMLFVTCVAAANCSERKPVVDPEQVLVALDQARSRTEAQASDSAAGNSALVFLAVTSDLSSIGRGHDHHAGERTALAAGNLRTSELTSEQRLASIASAKEMWSTTALRRTTVLAGHGAAGLVYVPLDPGARYVWLDVKAGRHDFWFTFEQAITPERREHEEERAED